MKILPYMNRGIPLAISNTNDGSIMLYQEPLQIYQADGNTYLRIANTLIWFDENGRVAGIECKLALKDMSPNQHDAVRARFADADKNSGMAPTTPFHQHGTPGHRKETIGWAHQSHIPLGEDYAVMPKTKES